MQHCFVFIRYTLSNKYPSAWNFLSPELEVTWRTVAIIIRVVLLSLYLHIRGLSLYSIHGWKRRVGNYQKLKTDLAVTIQSLNLSWLEAESLYRSVLTASRRNPGSWTRASSYYYRYSALGLVWAETRAQSGDWYGSGTLHPGQVLRGSLPLLSPGFVHYWIEKCTVKQWKRSVAVYRVYSRDI